MSFIHKHARVTLIAISCAVLGAAASAIAAAGASTPGHSAAGKSAMRGRRAGGVRRLALRSVHGQLVVKTKSGFATVTFDRGKVDSVSRRQLTMTDGTKKSSYKTVTVTIPSGAAVRDDRKPASLSDLKAGQRVVVVQAPKRTVVVARTPKTP